MGYTVTHLDEALPAMWDALSDSFNKAQEILIILKKIVCINKKISSKAENF